MHVDEFADGRFQVFYTAEHAPSNSLVGEFGEPSLHQVDPGSVGGLLSVCEGRPGIRDRGRPLPNSQPLVHSLCDHTTRSRLADGEGGKFHA